MLSILGSALLGVGILFLVLMVWVGVQHLFRKSEGLPTDCDVLGDTGRGCSHCGQRDACTIIKERRE
ncbi:MAG TPA: hypothetical protein ENN29_10370 [Candidatus Hydrogenedentes bacterium]|nr:hypothetical protein [Candidatus Hydrogenedentota bacterium]